MKHQADQNNAEATSSPSNRALYVIILAAGKGTRMRSPVPKVMHPLGRIPILEHLHRSASRLNPEQIITVIGPDHEEIANMLEGRPTVVQHDRRGTGHAIKVACEALTANGTLEDNADIMVLLGDMPLVKPDTLKKAIQAQAEGKGMSVVGFDAKDPAAYGRLIVDEKGHLTQIIEAADATPQQLAITLCNSGIMAFDAATLPEWLGQLKDHNAQKELYAPDLVGIAHDSGADVRLVMAEETEVMGINSQADLAAAEAVLQNRLRQKAMEQGVCMPAPETVFLANDTVFGEAVTLEPHVVIADGVRLGDYVRIRAFSHLEDCVVQDGAVVGPYARLRPGADIGPKARIGNFVEVKKSTIGPGSKVNHLSYIGDTQMGAGVNVGAGTITCNYDGFDKHKTRMGDGVFVGSNSCLVAPVDLQDGAMVAAGSVITKNVATDTLAVARGQQKSVEGWASRFRAEKTSDTAKKIKKAAG